MEDTIPINYLYCVEIFTIVVATSRGLPRAGRGGGGGGGCGTGRLDEVERELACQCHPTAAAMESCLCLSVTRSFYFPLQRSLLCSETISAMCSKLEDFLCVSLI